MNREIEFRGFRVDGHGWVYGLLSHDCNSEIIDCLSISENWWTKSYEVDPKSISQYTNFNDREGSRIYEKQQIAYAGKCYTIKMIDGCWKAILQGGSYQFFLSEIAQYSKVIEEDFKPVKQPELC